VQYQTCRVPVHHLGLAAYHEDNRTP
jgi:hypothetical protein